MTKEKNSMLIVEYQQQPQERHSLKQKLMAAVANGDEATAREIRESLKGGAEKPLAGDS